MKRINALRAVKGMKRIKQAVVTACLCMAATAAAGQQVPQYSQYLINGILVNPAYTGYRETMYAQVFYHNQWTRAGTPQYFAFALDGRFTDGVNAGITFSDERMGLLAISSVSAMYAYRMQTSAQSDLSFGISLGAMYYSMDYSKMKPFTPADPVLISLSNRWVPNINVGVYYGSDKFFMGLSARNITDGRSLGGHVVDDFIIPLSTWNSVLTMGFSIPLNERLELRPSMMWQDDFAAPSHIDITTALLFVDRFWIGLSFRTDQHLWKTPSPGNINELYSAAIMAEVFVTNQITMSYAFDVGLNQDSYHYFGGHEISIGYYFSRKIDSRYNRRYRYKKYQVDGVCQYCPW